MAEHSLARINELREWSFFESKLFYNSFSKPMEERSIPVLERVMVTNLLKENGRIAGVATTGLTIPRLAETTGMPGETSGKAQTAPWTLKSRNSADGLTEKDGPQA